MRVVDGAAGVAAQINRGVAESGRRSCCVLHADTLLPDDAVAVMPPRHGGPAYGAGRLHCRC